MPTGFRRPPAAAWSTWFPCSPWQSFPGSTLCFSIPHSLHQGIWAECFCEAKCGPVSWSCPLTQSLASAGCRKLASQTATYIRQPRHSKSFWYSGLAQQVCPSDLASLLNTRKSARFPNQIHCHTYRLAGLGLGRCRSPLSRTPPPLPPHHRMKSQNRHCCHSTLSCNSLDPAAPGIWFFFFGLWVFPEFLWVKIIVLTSVRTCIILNFFFIITFNCVN